MSIKNEAEWLQRIQDSQRQYELERKKIDDQKRDVEADTAKIKKNYDELLQLQVAIAEEIGRTLQLKEEARNAPRSVTQPAEMVEAEQADPSLQSSKHHSRVTSNVSSDDDEEISPVLDAPASHPESQNEQPKLVDALDQDYLIPPAKLVKTFPYRCMEKIGKKIASSTIIGNQYEIKSPDDVKSATKQFGKLRCIKRIHVQTTPIHRPPIQVAEKTENEASISALVYKKRLADLKKLLRVSTAVARKREPEYRTQASVSFFVTEALSDDEATNMIKSSNVLCAFRFRLQATDGTQTANAAPYINQLESILTRWTRFAEVRLNTQLRDKNKGSVPCPQFKCTLGRLPQMGGGIGYEVLWQFDDSKVPAGVGGLKAEQVARDDNFRYLLNNLTSMILSSTGVLLEQHKGTVEQKMSTASDEMGEFVDGEMVAKAQGVFAEVVSIHQKLNQIFHTSTTRNSPEIVLLQRRYYLLLSCLAHHKSFLEVNGTIGWDTDVVHSPRLDKKQTGPAAKSYDAFDLGDMLKMMSPGDGVSTTEQALEQWNQSGQKVFENMNEFLIPLLHYFQIDDPKHPKDQLYNSAHLDLNLINVPHVVLNSIHKLIDYRKDGIVLSRTVIDENGTERKIRGRTKDKSSMFSTKSKVTLGLTFFDELHFDIRRPRPADQQNGIDNESLIELAISNRMEEAEARTAEQMQEIKARIADETQGDGSAKFSQAKKFIDTAVQEAHEMAEENQTEIDEWKALMGDVEIWNNDPNHPRLGCTAMRVIVPSLAPKSSSDRFQPPPRFLNLRWTLNDVSVNSSPPPAQ